MISKCRNQVLDVKRDIVPAHIVVGTLVMDGKAVRVGVTLGTMMPIVVDAERSLAFIGCWCGLMAQFQDAVAQMPEHQDRGAPTCH